MISEEYMPSWSDEFESTSLFSYEELSSLPSRKDFTKEQGTAATTTTTASSNIASKNLIYLEDVRTSSRWLLSSQGDNNETTATTKPSPGTTTKSPPGYFSSGQDNGYDGPSTFDRGLQMVFSSFFVVVFW